MQMGTTIPLNFLIETFSVQALTIQTGICLNNLNVTAMDSRDSKGRGRFFPFLPEHHLNPGNVSKDYWYWNMIYYPVEKVANIIDRDFQRFIMI